LRGRVVTRQGDGKETKGTGRKEGVMGKERRDGRGRVGRREGGPGGE